MKKWILVLSILFPWLVQAGGLAPAETGHADSPTLQLKGFRISGFQPSKASAEAAPGIISSSSPLGVVGSFQSKPMNQLFGNYARRGGDISGGGFGLQILGTDHVILHDLWCADKNYQFAEDKKLSVHAFDAVNFAKQSAWSIQLRQVAPRELELALQRVQAWSGMAPLLMQEIRKNLLSEEMWHATSAAPKDNASDQFEFPGNADGLQIFHQTYQETQVAQVQRYPGYIFITSDLWDRMDLQSRAGLLVHESLRMLYLKSIKGYLLPSILQWTAGNIMMRNPSLPQDHTMIESFYQELFVTMDNSGLKDQRRPLEWRSELCEQRQVLADTVRSSLPKMSFVSSLSAAETMQAICDSHQRAREMLTHRNSLVIVKSFDQLPDACDANQLEQLPTFTLVYWLQKKMDIGLTWSAHNQPDLDKDLPYLLATEKNFVSRAAFEVTLQRFLSVGDQYCARRADYYGSGEEFVALGDVLLDSLSH